MIGRLDVCGRAGWDFAGTALVDDVQEVLGYVDAPVSIAGRLETVASAPNRFTEAARCGECIAIPVSYVFLQYKRFMRHLDIARATRAR